jgi:hypothetical protein
VVELECCLIEGSSVSSSLDEPHTTAATAQCAWRCRVRGSDLGWPVCATTVAGWLICWPRSLSLVAACPERADYWALTNLQILSELRVSYATNFGDAELASLTNLVKLRSLSISFDAISPAGTNVLAHMMQMTNVNVRIR